MRVRPLGSGALLIALALFCAASRTWAADNDKHISVWIIPPEESGPNDAVRGEDIPSRMEALRLAMAGTRVRLLNVEYPLAAKTGSHRSGTSGEAGWFPEYTGPNFQVVVNQRKTFAALARFAEQNNTDIVLRLITWREAAELLRAGRNSGPDALPDVMEVGTTWTANLAASGRIRSRPDWRRNKGNWRDVLSIPASALPYTTDVRLLFYWKRLPTTQPDSPPLTLDNSSWPALLDSVGRGTSSADIIALPTAITLNLLYDYVPLVRAGDGAPLIHDDFFGPRVSFSNEGALKVPIYLTAHSGVPLDKGEVRQLVSFPETTHEEVARAFVNGDYRATLEPVSFMGRWADDFNERQRQKGDARRFWDYAAAVVPPEGFKGGGELVVLSHTSQPELAFKLADYLATDPEYTEMLAQAGFLPPGRPGFGIDTFVASLIKDERDVRDAGAFADVARKAIDRGDRYPDFARWTEAFESQTVLEKLQRVWRRMAEGDIDGVHQAAKDVDWEINSQIYMPSRALNAFIQSWRLVAVILFLGAFLVVAAGIHRRRLQLVTRQFDMRLEERINERTRIARELHDTLLQSFQGLMLRFQTVNEMLPAKPMEAKKALEAALDRADQAIGEGRDAITDMRSSALASHDLSKSITALMANLHEEVAAENGRSVTFRVLAEGAPRAVRAPIQDEIYRISRESLRNAFRHAQARHIETEITYGESLRLRFRDDGKGIDPSVIQRGGRAGHWGLPGLRERAKHIGGQIEVWSEVGAGTEVELSIPGSIAYEATPARPRFRFFGKAIKQTS